MSRTGQVWKLYLLPVSTILGSALIFWSGWLKEKVADAYFLFFLLGGMTVIVGGTLIAGLSIFCPKCHLRWLLSLYKREPVANWFRVMRNMARCPRCGFYG